MKQLLLSILIFSISQSQACTDIIFSNEFEPAIQTHAEAARLLQQATFGSTNNSINQARFKEFDAWIDQQLCTPPTHITPTLLDATGQLLPARLNLNWQSFVYANDQLRQRVAFALSEIMVVSQTGFDCGNCPIGIANYHDTLVTHAFGNYRELLEAVTLNPTMGFYLSMLGNAKADELANTRADENFAREIMQLFSLGLTMLNPDGTETLDGMLQPIATYDISHIKELAKVLTGWNWGGTPSWDFPVANLLAPMEPYMELGTAPYHDYTAKQIIGSSGLTSSTAVPAGLTPEADLQLALDTIFAHPNVGPFIGKQLIQKLVTSNPSPAYVGRITAVFNDDGTGTRGNLGAVVKAILLDEEARDPLFYQADTYGKLREPILRLTHLWRAFGAQINYQEQTTDFIFLGQQLGQSPYQAPSVFNFYRPDYLSNDVSDPDLVAPVFQINNESKLINYQNLLRSLSVFGFTGGLNLNFQHVIMDGAPIRSWLLQSNQHFLDQLNLLLFSNQMSPGLYALLDSLLIDYAAEFGNPNDISSQDLTTRAALLIYLAMTSPEYLIQK